MIPLVRRQVVSWGFAFRLRQHLKGSLWVLPLIGGIAGGLLGSLGLLLDREVDLPTYWSYAPGTATTILSAIVASTAALTGFIVTVSVLVVQMATGTFSARYMRLWYRDRLLKALLAVSIGTLTFSFQLLRQIEPDFVPNLGVTLAGALMVFALLLFLFFLDRFIHRLRPVAVAALVGQAGEQAFLEVRRDAEAPDAPTLAAGTPAHPGTPDLVVKTDRAGAIQALNGAGLVEFAHEHSCVLVLPCVVGDFLPAGAPLIHAYGLADVDTTATRRLRGMVALGDERTIEQDPAFALRILVDIAIRALSPAVNDPTTAVQVIDHLTDMLLLIGATDMEERKNVAAEPASPAVLMPGRLWEDYLALGVTEIREYGDRSIQVHRRLRAMLEELHAGVRPEHQAAVDEELARLANASERHFGGSVDYDRARGTDRQGIGGPGSLARGVVSR
jgi:uncharacterized membrane protein